MNKKHNANAAHEAQIRIKNLIISYISIVQYSLDLLLSMKEKNEETIKSTNFALRIK